MNMSRVESRESRAETPGSGLSTVGRRLSTAFTLVEIMVVVTLLSLIVLALMAVFSSTQQAFRASVTQADLLEGGRAAIDFMAADVRTLTPGGANDPSDVHFSVAVTNYGWPPSPLYQPLVASTFLRSNVLENFFILSRGNADGVPTWYGVGYAVTATNASAGPLYSLYRFATNHPGSTAPSVLYRDYVNFLTNVSRGGSHLMDGVVHLTVRAYDTNGVWMNVGYTNASGFLTNAPQFGETSFRMYNRTLPASVEIEMGVLEDRTLQRAESFGGALAAQSNYLVGAASKVHVFRQRVAIQSVNPAGFQ